MGAVFFAAGSLNLLVRPGPWMVWVRYAFGVILFGVALLPPGQLGPARHTPDRPASPSASSSRSWRWWAVARHLCRKEGERIEVARMRGAILAVCLIITTGVVAFLTRSVVRPEGWIKIKDVAHLEAGGRAGHQGEAAGRRRRSGRPGARTARRTTASSRTDAYLRDDLRRDWCASRSTSRRTRARICGTAVGLPGRSAADGVLRREGAHPARRRHPGVARRGVRRRAEEARRLPRSWRDGVPASAGSAAPTRLAPRTRSQSRAGSRRVETRIYVDGRITRPEEAVVPVLDRGFLYGDSVYEVLWWHRGVLVQRAGAPRAACGAAPRTSTWRSRCPTRRCSRRSTRRSRPPASRTTRTPTCGSS